MNYLVNISLQVLPSSESKHPYDIVDKAIEVIAASGIKYKVCPFETVMEGNYDDIMQVIKKVFIECMEYGAESIFSNIKVQINSKKDVFIEDKTGKYE
ncbi:MAG: thiamine-binding protein [Bacteroidales bacterium]|nr:thiamine-binding protein [Bacteroidales bacterium]MBN2819667.1 thiamine-binding protein [Bacteroidales bacterium]